MGRVDNLYNTLSASYLAEVISIVLTFTCYKLNEAGDGGVKIIFCLGLAHLSTINKDALVKFVRKKLVFQLKTSPHAIFSRKPLCWNLLYFIKTLYLFL